ncbi:M16 family metallopeptidase [Cellulomonas shaoxiangyii]|uniref:Insulinase family protein n=1 Tax=Cellulomonas shaoxiangyii TaxID=2566013 RepID=A0A4P7SPQ1_9CELL|nr:insulinase family protein [Cellulomonas shaoxiangyii]QCB94974.1 insulinase family protein [Cellulomonas shaoxiangyii]TGY79103.1 insulinase family protein [Cellulomonas shaoxiangyii]
MSRSDPSTAAHLTPGPDLAAPLDLAGAHARTDAPPTVRVRAASGLAVVAVRLPTVPLVEVRLRVPLHGAAPAGAVLLAHLLARPDRPVPGGTLAAQVQRLGGHVAVGADADALQVSAGCLAEHLPRLLALLAHVLGEDVAPDGVPAPDRTQVAQVAAMGRAQPALRAVETLNRSAYGGRHPYGRAGAGPAEVLELPAPEVEALRRARVLPGAATLVLVGDLDPDRAAAAAQDALRGWTGTPAAPPLPPVPRDLSGPVVLDPVPGAVQSCLRAALPVVGRAHPDYAALQVANLVLGGYFSSRLVLDLRERRGICYGARTAFVHAHAGALLVASVDVGRDATAEALGALWDQLDGLRRRPPTALEHGHARRHALGAQQLAASTQGSYADRTVELEHQGLGAGWVAAHLEQLTRVTARDVAAAVERHLDPARAALVLTGDAVVAAPLAPVAAAVGRALQVLPATGTA